MAHRILQNLNEFDRGRRRLLLAIGGGIAGTLCSPILSGRAWGYTKMQSLTLGRPLMGTVVEIEANHPDPSIVRDTVQAGLQRMADVDCLMSTFRSDSEIGLVNRLAATRPVPIGKETFDVLTQAKDIALLSGGALDVTIHPLKQLWRSATQRGRLPSSREIEATLGLVAHNRLSVDRNNRHVRLLQPGMGIDLSGIAKGYAVDVAAQTLKQRGVDSGLVNAGGDLRVVGRNRDADMWRIGVRHPLAPSRLLLSVLLEDEAAATSGNYFRYFTVGGRQYGHLLHPRTGMPANGALSATVIAKSTMRADGLATAAMIHGTDAMAFIQGVSGVEGIVVNPLAHHPGKVSVHITPGLRGRVELLDRSAELER